MTLDVCQGLFLNNMTGLFGFDMFLGKPLAENFSVQPVLGPYWKPSHFAGRIVPFHTTELKQDEVSPQQRGG